MTGPVDIRQAVVHDNGSGLRINSSGMVTIDQCTIRDNQGYGLTLDGGPFATVSNSIFWFNKFGSQYTQISCPNAYLDVTYSNIQGLGSYGISGGIVTIDAGSIEVNPQFIDDEGRLAPTSPSVDAATPWLHDAHMPPGLGTIVADMGAFGGPGNHIWGGDPIPDGTPEIQAIVDIPQDNGGFVGIQYDASLFDGQHPAYDITRYSFWRAMDLGTTASDGKGAPSASWYPTKTFFQTATSEFWEHVGDMTAQEFANYAYTAPTYADSVDGNPYDIDFLVIAHTPDEDIFFTSLPAAGHSVDNLAPPAPEELAALPTFDGVSLTWTPSLADDVALYWVYRSLDPGSPLEARDLVGTTADTSYLDEYVGELVDYFYVVVPQDVHGNIGEPSPVASALIAVPVLLDDYSAKLVGAVPTLTWSVTTTEEAEFRIVREATSGALDELDPALIQPTRDGFTYRDVSALPGQSYGYTVHAMASGVWLTLFTSEDIATPRLEFGIRSVAPNPFNPATTISFATTESGRATVEIYDVRGRRVRTLFDENTRPRLVELTWHGDDESGVRVSSGTYFVVLRSGEGTQTQKVMLVK
jgi:hypothetical protein